MHDMPHDAQREVPHNTPHGGQREVPHGAPHVTQREVSPDLRRDDPASVFAGVRAQFDAASRVAGGVVTRACRVAGHRITLQFAGDALVEHLTRALAHVIAAAEDEEQVGTTSLTIRIWHRDSTRDVAPLLPAWWWRDSSMRGQPQAYHGGRFHTAVHADTLSMLDASAGEACYFVGDRGALGATEMGSPLLRILHWWMQRCGLQLVHGGAVGSKDGGVILAGRGGAGKSTSCLLSLGAGLDYVGDDYCLVGTDPDPVVHSLYCSGKVAASDLDRFPFLAPALVNRDRLAVEKAVFMPREVFPDRVSLGFPVRAVLVPRVVATRATCVTPISAADGLLALAPSTIFQLPGAGASALRTLGRLTSRVPSFRLDVGSDLAGVPRAIHNLLERL